MNDHQNVRLSVIVREQLASKVLEFFVLLSFSTFSHKPIL